MSMPQTPRENLIQFLRGQPNPFDEFVAADEACAHILRNHVPAMYAPQREAVLCAMDRYRQAKQGDELQLPASRLVRIRSPRGGGKTHLGNWIKCRAGGQELFVCPRYFEGETHFNEYVLQQLIGTLLNVDDEEDDIDVTFSNTLNGIAKVLARRMLQEAVRSLSVHQWLYSTDVVHGFGVVLGWRWKRARKRQSFLVDQLVSESDQSLLAICQSCGLRRRTALKLLDAFISRRESGNSIVSQMRRGFLRAISILGITGDREPIQQFLETDFANIPAATTATRNKLVESLLCTTVEMLAVSGYPVVFLFDNIERLFRPHGQFNSPLAQDFFTNLAHVTDYIPGILFLFFVEEGAWHECLNAMDQFAEHRLLQRGVRLQTGQDLREVVLPNPTEHEVRAFVEQRMRGPIERGLRECRMLPNEIPVSPIFPFPESEDFSRAGVLRETILHLRDRYAEILGWEINNSLGGRNGTPPVMRTQLEVETDVLDPLWQQQVNCRMEEIARGQKASQAREFLNGLVEWLNAVVIERPINGWQLTSVVPQRTFGKNANYGKVTVVEWQQSGKTASRCVAVGVMLGGSSGKPTDMRTKLCMFNEREAIAEELILLWPHDDGPAFTADLLPTGTRNAWEEVASNHNVALRGITNQEVAMLLGFGEWLTTVNQRRNEDQERDVEWPTDAAKAFAWSVTRSLSALILPLD